MTRVRSRAAAALVLTALLSTAASAQNPTAAGRVVVLQSMTLTRLSGLSFGKLHTDNGHGPGTVTVAASPPFGRSASNTHLMQGAGHGPAVTTIQGEPGRLYRVTLPAQVTTTSDGLQVADFTLRSDVRGDVTASGVGQLGPDGRDTLRIGATLTVPAKTKPKAFAAEVPIVVSYE